TTTVPVISGWNWQANANEPGATKVREKLAPAAMVPESNEPSPAVTVCGAVPAFCHATVVPTGTRTSPGSNAKSTIVTVRPGAAAKSNGSGVGVGVGVAAGAGAAGPAALDARTTTVPRISGW